MAFALRWFFIIKLASFNITKSNIEYYVKSLVTFLPPAFSFGEVTGFWTSAKASVQNPVTSPKLQAGDKNMTADFP